MRFYLNTSRTLILEIFLLNVRWESASASAPSPIPSCCGRPGEGSGGTQIDSNELKETDTAGRSENSHYTNYRADSKLTTELLFYSWIYKARKSWSWRKHWCSYFTQPRYIDTHLVCQFHGGLGNGRNKGLRNLLWSFLLERRPKLADLPLRLISRVYILRNTLNFQGNMIKLEKSICRWTHLRGKWNSSHGGGCLVMILTALHKETHKNVLCEKLVESQEKKIQETVQLQ